MRRGWCTFLLGLWMLTVPMSASSFALRTLEKGDKAPDVLFAGLTGEGGKLSSFLGAKGAIVIYWATWSSRSPDLLRFAEKELKGYEAKGLKILAVDADHQEMKAEDVSAVKAMVASLGLSFPVVLDPGLTGYNAIGIISVPTTLIVDKDLKILEAYPGFPSVARDDITERVEAFLGIVREKRAEKAQYLLDHAPKNYALQYYNLGKRVYIASRTSAGDLRAIPEQAIDRLDEAIKRDPDYFRPYLLKAIILHQAKANGRREKALETLRKKEFQEVYERRVLGFGYLYMGMDNVAADHLQAASGILAEDPGILFGQAVAAARTNRPEAARKAVEALRKIDRAKEKLGFEYEPFFTEKWELKAGTGNALRAALDRILEIEKPSQGGLRSDAPVQGAAGTAAPGPADAGGTAPAAAPAKVPEPPKTPDPPKTLGPPKMR